MRRASRHRHIWRRIIELVRLGRGLDTIDARPIDIIDDVSAERPVYRLPLSLIGRWLSICRPQDCRNDDWERGTWRGANYTGRYRDEMSEKRH